MKHILILGCILMLTACISAPSGLERDKFALHSLSEIDKESGNCQCKTVRLGGKIINVKALKDKMRLEILSLPIEEYSAKPRLNFSSDGRFIAYIPNFIDPERLKEQYITVAGVLHKNEQGYIDEASYSYPVVAVEHYQLWKKVKEYYYDPDDWNDYWEDRRSLWRMGGFYSFEQPVMRVRYNLYP